MSHSVYHYLSPVRKLKDGRYPVKLVININGVRKNYKTTFKYTKDEWKRLTGTKLRDIDLQADKARLDKRERQAKAILNDLPIPTHQAFEKEYSKKTLSKNQSLRFWFDEYNKLQERLNKAYGSRRLLRTVINSLEKYRTNLTFSSITPEFLNEYEAWLLGRGKTHTTVDIYLTQVRLVFNYAIKEGVIPRELYPFGKQVDGYVIKNTRGRKHALKQAQVIQLLNYQCPSSENEFARDMWIVLFLLNGMNIADLIRLRYKNFDFNNKTFHFQRTKTKGTMVVRFSIEGGIHPVAEKIIEKYGNDDKSAENYVFPFLNKLEGDELNRLKEEYYIKTDLLKLINENLKFFKEKLKLPFNLTVSVARHTYANVLRYEKGYEPEIVGDSMGHTDIKTTQFYFAGTDIEEKVKMNLDLLPVKTQPRKKHAMAKN